MTDPLVERWVQPLSQGEDAPTQPERVQVSALRGLPAWVLLGEPGAGKSTLFETEAQLTGGVYLTAAEFLNGLAPAPVAGETLFIDALDEARAGSRGVAMVMQMRKLLQDRGRPRYRLSCRAADWLGEIDAQPLAAASPNGKVPVYTLCGLSDQDVKDIVGDDRRAVSLMAEAAQAGHDALLRNPLALKMRRDGSTGDHLGTKLALFGQHVHLLVQERNEIHQQALLAAPSTAARLDAAGQLFATLLFSDLDGVSLTNAQADARHAVWTDFSLDDLPAAAAALHSQLFCPGRRSGQHRPVHRAVAEFLAAKWLAARINEDPFAQARVLNLMMGSDGRPVTGLRGLYAWLATLSTNARGALIQRDPLTVALYGDPAALPSAGKCQLLEQLLEQEQELSFAYWGPDRMPWVALWDESSADMVRTRLESVDRSAHAQRQVMLLLSVLEAAPLEHPERWAPLLWPLACDTSRWGGVRVQAAYAALQLGTDTDAAKAVLDAIGDGRLPDEDDELAGLLLSHLYPGALTLEDAIRHLHAPKREHLTGSFQYFWTRQFVELVPTADLRYLPEILMRQRPLLKAGWGALGAGALVHGALARVLAHWGQSVNDATLLQWLRLLLDDEGEPWRYRALVDDIDMWMSHHPERCKGVLQQIHQACIQADSFQAELYVWGQVVDRWIWPDDLSGWYLEQVDATDHPQLRDHCFQQAMRGVLQGQGAKGLTLDTLVAWAASCPVHQQLWDAWRVVDIPEWKIRDNERMAVHEARRQEDKKARTVQVMPMLEQIRRGEAPAGWMHQLAGVWQGHFYDVPGRSPAERFLAFTDHGEVVHEAARQGFLACVRQAQLPAVDELVKLQGESRQHFLSLPCLTGVELEAGADLAFADEWPDARVASLAAMVLTRPLQGTVEQWYRHVAVTRPMAVSIALVACVKATWRREHVVVPGLHDLLAGEPYGALARHALPPLLQAFPSRVGMPSIQHLRTLLQAAARHVPGVLADCCDQRVARKSLDAMQQLCWLTAAALLQPQRYERSLLERIGGSQKRAQEVANLLTRWPSESLPSEGWRPRLLARLIELLAPHATLNWERGGGLVTPSMALGGQLRGLVTLMAQTGSEAAVLELDRLSQVPALKSMRELLVDAVQQARVQLRERCFRYPGLAAVQQALSNGSPAVASDLWALAQAALFQLSKDLRESNANLWRRFWVDARPGLGDRWQHHDENDCRDVILHDLRLRLTPYQIDVQPEAQHANEKRADLRLSCGVAFELPIEVKGEWHPDVWKAMSTQLDRFYTTCRSDGHGIYLVLWTGEHSLHVPPDGQPRPTSPAALRDRLLALLTPEQRRRIAVIVLDISPA